MSDNDDIFADFPTFELDDFILNDQTEQELKNLPQSNEKTPLTEQLKIWDQFQKITNDLSPRQQALALTSFITSPTSSDLQKKALDKLVHITDEISESQWIEISKAIKPENEKKFLAIADTLLNQKDKERELFAIFGGSVLKPKEGFQLTEQFNFTERFISQPRPYLKLLTEITKQYPYRETSENFLDSIYTTLKNSPQNTNLKEVIDETAGTIYDIRREYKKQQIDEYYAHQKNYHNIKPAQNNSKTPTSPSLTR